MSQQPHDWKTAGDWEQPQPDVSVNVHLGRAKPLRAADHALGLVRTALPPAIRADRLRLVAYNATAAYAGWQLGIVDWGLDGIQHYGQGDTHGGVWVGVGLCLAASIVDLRTHHLRTPGRHWIARSAGWAARIPLTSALLALALYTSPLGGPR